MNRAFAFVLSLLVATSMVPFVAAQEPIPTYVEGCTKECKPADVQPETRTGADSAKVILYGHFVDILNRAPLNTQIPCLDPCPAAEEDLNRGFLTPTVSTRANPEVDLRFENNWFYMFSSAGLVEIQNGQWRTHQEPGLAQEVTVVGNEIKLYFYLSAYPVPNQDSSSGTLGDNALAVMPQVAIYARMETGRFAFGGELIAEGDTAADDSGGLAGSPGRVNIIKQPGGGPDIYEFEVPMAVKNNGKIPDVASGTHGFLVSINPYQIKGKDGSPIKDYQVMQNDWRVRVGPSTPPRLVLEIEKPLDTLAASLSLFNKAMYVRWSFISPWGSYDVAEPTLAVQLTGPSSPDPSKVGLSRPAALKRSVDHDAHFKPVNATWRFDYQRADLEDGQYTVQTQITNLQGTYRLQESLQFTIEDGVPINMQIIGAPPPGAQAQQAAKEDAPGLAGIAAVAALASAAIVLQRRRN